MELRVFKKKKLLILCTRMLASIIIIFIKLIIIAMSFFFEAFLRCKTLVMRRIIRMNRNISFSSEMIVFTVCRVLDKQALFRLIKFFEILSF